MKTWLRLTLITLTVGGGFMGATVTLQAVFRFEFKNSQAMATALVFAVLYLFTLAAGLLLAHDPNRTKPLVIALALQLPTFTSPFIAYHFAPGLMLRFGVAQTGYF